MDEVELTAKAPAPETRTEAWLAFIAANLAQATSRQNANGAKKIRRQAKVWGLHMFTNDYMVNRQSCQVRDIRTGKKLTVPVPTMPHQLTVSDVEELLEKYEVLEEYKTLHTLQREAVEWYKYRNGSIVRYIRHYTSTTRLERGIAIV